MNYRKAITVLYTLGTQNYIQKRFVYDDNGSMGGNRCVVFYMRNIKSYYVDSFGGPPDKFSLRQLPKPITY